MTEKNKPIAILKVELLTVFMFNIIRLENKDISNKKNGYTNILSKCRSTSVRE